MEKLLAAVMMNIQLVGTGAAATSMPRQVSQARASAFSRGPGNTPSHAAPLRQRLASHARPRARFGGALDLETHTLRLCCSCWPLPRRAKVHGARGDTAEVIESMKDPFDKGFTVNVWTWMQQCCVTGECQC